jgi:hypothetical protein
MRELLQRLFRRCALHDFVSQHNPQNIRDVETLTRLWLERQHRGMYPHY